MPMHGYRPTVRAWTLRCASSRPGARQVFREVASGAKTDRAQLRRVLAQLDIGDVLMVTRLDRLARSTRDLLNTLATIAGQGPASDCVGRHHPATSARNADRAS